MSLLKRIIRVLLLLLILLLFASSCVNTRGQLPYGIWQSKEPDLVFDIDPQCESFFKGQYTEDGKSINVFVAFAVAYKEFGIYDESEVDIAKGSIRHTEDSIFEGSYKMKGDKLIYTLNPHWREVTGYKTITFDKIKEYDTSENGKD